MSYKIARNGNVIGEFELKEIARLIEKKEILPSDFAWQAGMQDWVAVASILPSIHLVPSIDILSGVTHTLLRLTILCCVLVLFYNWFFSHYIVFVYQDGLKAFSFCDLFRLANGATADLLRSAPLRSGGIFNAIPIAVLAAQFIPLLINSRYTWPILTAPMISMLMGTIYGYAKFSSDINAEIEQVKLHYGQQAAQEIRGIYDSGIDLMISNAHTGDGFYITILVSTILLLVGTYKTYTTKHQLRTISI